MRRICVFAGSNPGARDEYRAAAVALGHELAARGLELVYGGASVGLMGVVADAILAAGGKAHGVLPRGLFRTEVAHSGLTELHEVDSMHERKDLMARLADGFIALPGGYGTFDELFEIVTWAQIGIHEKPVGLLDVMDYYQPLLKLVAHATREGFVSERHAGILMYERAAPALLDRFAAYTPPAHTNKWTELPPEP